MKIGSIHGRFQPFHNEHLEYALSALEHCDFLWIGITQYDIEELQTCQKSPNRSSIISNPLTYLERIEIIRSALIEANIDNSKFSFVPFPIDQPEKLYQYIDTKTICFTTVRESWNKSKIDRLRAAGYEVHILWENLEEKLISSTLIRNSVIADDNKWKEMVLPSTKEYLLKLDLKSRIIELGV